MAIIKKIENEMKYFEFFKELLKRNIRRRYFNPVLRAVIIMLIPVLPMLAAAPIMSLLFKESVPNYPVFFYCGETVFIFLFYCVYCSLKAIKRNAFYIRASAAPKHLFVVSAVAEGSVPFILSLLPLFIIIPVTGAMLTLNMLIIPLLFALMFMFALGFSLVMTAYAAILGGFNRLYVVISAVWLLASPVFYPLSAVPEKIRFVFDANPAVHYMEIMRTICYGDVPSERSLIVASIYSVLVLLLGISVFKSKEDKLYLYV